MTPRTRASHETRYSEFAAWKFALIEISRGLNNPVGAGQMYFSINGNSSEFGTVGMAEYFAR